MIDVAQNIKQSVPLVIIYSRSFQCILKETTFWTPSFSNVLLCVKCLLFSLLTDIMHQIS